MFIAFANRFRRRLSGGRRLPPATARLALLLSVAVTAAGCGGGGSGGSSSGGGTSNVPPTAQPSGSPETGTPPLLVAFDGSGSSDPDGSISSYTWDFDDGSANASGVSVDHTFDAVGTYQVELTVTDDEGATATQTLTIEVIDGEAPVAVASATPENGVAPLLVEFSSAGSSDPDGSIVDYRWDFDDGGNVEFGQSPEHVFDAGSYDVTLTVIDEDGLTDTATITILVSPPDNEPPEAAFSVTPDAGAAPLQTAFDGSASSDSDGTIVSYQWDFGDGASASGATASHTYTENGAYSATLTVVDDQGGVGTSTRTISVGTAPSAAVSASPDVGTPSLTVTFDASASSDDDGSVARYHWDFDDGDTSTVEDAETTHTFDDVGLYQVSLRVEDDEGLLSAPVSYQINVTQDPESLSLRDFFDTDSRDQYDYTTGSGQAVAHVTDPDPDYGDYLDVVAGTGALEISRAMPADDTGFFQIHFWPQQDNGSASFALYLEENDTTYYLVEGEAEVASGESGASISKWVNGVMVDQAQFPAKAFGMGANPFGYTNGLRYSINVAFSPSRMTTEFTELRPRVVSMNGDATPIKVSRMRLLFDSQDAFLDNIIKEPIEPDQLDYYVGFGDSITEGTGDEDADDGRSFPIELQRRLLDERVTSQVVFNEGFGGMTTLEARNEVPNLLARHPDAEVVLIMIGTNDGLQGNIGPTTYRGHLQAIVDAVRDAGKLPLLAKIPAEAPNQTQRDRMSAFNDEIDTLLADPDNADIYVEPPDFECYFQTHPALINADAIHPTAQGYRDMAALWQKMIGLGAAGTAAQACDL